MVKLHFKRTVIFGILGLIAGILTYILSPRIYETGTGMIVGGETKVTGSQYTPDVQQILAQGAAQGPVTEIQVLRSKQVFYRALSAVAAKREDGQELLKDFDRLYLMYDVLGQDGTSNVMMASNVAFLNVRAFDPQVAVDITNGIVEQYNEIRKASIRTAVLDAIKYLEGQVGEAQKDVQATQAAYRDYKQSAEVSDFQTKGSEEEKYVQNLQQMIDGMTAQIQSLDAKIASDERLMSAMPKQKLGASTEIKSPLVSQLEAKIASGESDRVALLTKYLPDSYEVRLLDQALAGLRAQLAAEKAKRPTEEIQKVKGPDPIRDAIENRLAQNRTERDGLMRQFASYQVHKAAQDSRIREMPSTEVNLLDRQRDLSLADQRYRNTKGMLDDLKNKTGTIERVAVSLGPPQVPEKPVAPEAPKLAFIGLLAGLCIGLVFSFGLESLKLRVHTSSQLAELTGLPVVAAVPLLPKPRAARLIRMLPKKEGSPAETFRYMAFFMQASDMPTPRVVMFTGAGNAVGCSTSAAQFAIAMARTGVSTLLVDADFRRADLSRLFEMSDRSGLADLLERTTLPGAGDSSMIQQTAHENLTLLPAGSNRETGLGDFQASHVQGVFQNLRDKAQVIVVDAPPCDAFSDASGLARHVDEVCLVVSARTTVFRSIPLAYEILTRAGAKNVSLVLTQASAQEEPFAQTGRNLARA